MTIEQDVLQRVLPNDAERQRVDDAVARLLASVQAAVDAEDPSATATVQGSIAKDTWHSGAMDVDLFVLFPTDVDADTIAQATRRVGEQVLLDAKQRYAQHPYIVGAFEGLTVDLVPAYAIDDATQKMSAVDRTPFHTRWVLANLDDRRRHDVRLAKQWLKGIGAYGAETATAGFSGYLVEVLIVVLGSFSALLAWLAGGAQPRRITHRDDRVDDDVSPLVVVDPVDPTRNCAAAVSEETLRLCEEAANAYHDEPALSFYFPATPEAGTPNDLRATLDERGHRWLGWVLTDLPERLDIVYPQFKKAADRIGQALADAGFTLDGTHTWTNERMVCMQWLLEAEPLPATRIHRGPPIDLEPNGERFRKKWDGHPDAPDGVHDVDGRLQVEVHVRHRTPDAWLAAHLDKLSLGKHVEKSRPTARLVTDLVDVPSPWSPIVTDFILGRRPWER